MIAVRNGCVPVDTVNSDPSQFQCYLDTPRDWSSLPPFLIVRGWCFGVNGTALQGIRLRVGSDGLTFQGLVGLSRPDVRAAYPIAPSDDTGFEIRVVLRPGPATFYLEGQTDDGTWRPVAVFHGCVARRWLPRWLRSGTATELIAFQMPAHMVHAPRPLPPHRPVVSLRPSSLRLSIVTPSFNQAAFLPETMESVLHQADANCDYVIQDGGSSDHSVERIKQHSARLHAWDSTPDSGQADAIAKGFAKTSGRADDIMAWINSDDFYLPGTLSYVLRYFERHPEVDVVYGHRILVNEASQEIGRWYLPRHDSEVLRLNDFIPQETLFWRRRLWEKVGGINPEFRFAMDWDLLLRFQAAGAKFVRLPRFLACFRIHSLQKTSAQLHSVGQHEIDQLRERTFGQVLPPHEIEQHPRLLHYLKRSAMLETLSRVGFLGFPG